MMQADFEQAEAFYAKLIEEKKSQIESMVSDELKDEFNGDMEHLDRVYEDLKTSFSETAEDQKLVDAMISNLQMRIEILNEQMKILKKLNETKNENDELVEI